LDAADYLHALSSSPHQGGKGEIMGHHNSNSHFESLRISTLIGVCLLFVIASGRTASAQTCAPAPAGLVGWWTGNGTAADAIAGNDGQLAGDATFAPAIVGQGFKFDGVGDAVEIPDSIALKPAHVSVEAWVRFDSLDTPIVSQFGAPGQQYILFKKNSRIFNFEAYAIRKQRDGAVDRLAFSVSDVNGAGNLALSTTAIVVGPFYHVVGTYDGSSVKLYVNGALEGQASAAVTIDYGTRPVFIATSGETVFDGKLNGIVDEASIYNRALDSLDVAALYAAGGAGKCASVTGLISNLAHFVQTLNLSKGISNSFDVKLQNALAALDDANAGHSSSVCNRMKAFLNEVRAQTGKALTDAQGGQLRIAAEQVRTALSCR
jgi:Concanavalin A-like lectin/glucanases superfamily